jgi:hypothetical protein
VRQTFSQRAIDLKHIGLILSVSLAVALRFFSDFSFTTIEHQALLAHVDVSERSLGGLGLLFLTTLSYQLERDWFNLSPQAPREVIGFTGLLVLAYVVLRRVLRAESAASLVMGAAPFLALGASIGACAWVLAGGRG